MSAKKAQLHPDLQGYVEPDGYTINHPLVRAILLPEWNHITNRVYLGKRRQIDQAVKQQAWTTYVALHERPYRVEALLELMNEFGVAGEHLWPVVGWLWSDTEGVTGWRAIWSEDPEYRHLVMDEKERQAFDQLPPELTIWRGVNRQNAVLSFSWTLDREKAVWFAHRFADDNDPLLLAEGRVSKAHVLAYFAGRKEAEIVVFPEDVRDITVIKLARR